MVALAVGSLELLQVFATRFGLDSGFWGWLDTLDFGSLGYLIVALFALTWIVAVGIWKGRRIEGRWRPRVREGSATTTAAGGGQAIRQAEGELARGVVR